jgi:hypothetical protein
MYPLFRGISRGQTTGPTLKAGAMQGRPGCSSALCLGHSAVSSLPRATHIPGMSTGVELPAALIPGALAMKETD